jgi:hypothetical protein
MCQYITIVVPIDVKLENIKPLITKHGLGCRPFQSNFILQQIPKGGQLVNTTASYCDCGSVIASASHPSTKEIKPSDIERLKRKGWSETKIKNWNENKSKTNTQAKEHDKERLQWTTFLEEVIMEKSIGKVGLYIHWYEDSMENEEIVFISRERVSVIQLKGDTLDKLNYDTLYEFIP